MEVAINIKFNTLPSKCQCYPHVETSQLICTANQLTGFYMRATLTINGLMITLVESYELLHSGFFFCLHRNLKRSQTALIFQSQQGKNHSNTYICSKLIMKTTKRYQWSRPRVLLLTFNRFHKLFWWFNSWLWPSKYWLGCYTHWAHDLSWQYRRSHDVLDAMWTFYVR